MAETSALTSRCRGLFDASVALSSETDKDKTSCLSDSWADSLHMFTNKEHSDTHMQGKADHETRWTS